VRFPGGTLVVERTRDDVLLTGAAERVFEATLDAQWLETRSVG
jgi:diaminopimelate epimerase